VVGGQIVVQWAEVEPEPGRYFFSIIAQQLSQLKKQGKTTSLQINGNEKPEWLFTQVPDHPEPLSV
jgi:beta-galactosidase GanA